MNELALFAGSELKTAKQQRDRVKKWREENPEYIKQYRVENRRRIYLVESQRKYGITPEQYEAICDLQKGACATCELQFDWADKQTAPHIDHCHKTGLIRGLLCNKCNTVLGLVNDSADRLQKLSEYIACHG
jgi:hypothetical protein